MRSAGSPRPLGFFLPNEKPIRQRSATAFEWLHLLFSLLLRRLPRASIPRCITRHNLWLHPTIEPLRGIRLLQFCRLRKDPPFTDLSIGSGATLFPIRALTQNELPLPGSYRPASPESHFPFTMAAGILRSRAAPVFPDATPVAEP